MNSLDKYKKRAGKIFLKTSKVKPLSIVDSSKGRDHTVFIIDSKKGKFVIRFAKEDFHTLKSHDYALKKWHKLGIPVPKILALGKDYDIETFIDGESIKKKELSDDIIVELANIIKKMHSLKTKKYSYIDIKGVGCKDSWEIFQRDFLRDKLLRIRKLMTSKEFAILTDFLEKNIVRDFNSPRLLHKDLNPDNILIHKGKISGIIDASDAISGDPLFDIAILYLKIREQDFYKFMKAYGTKDIKRIKYYAVIHCIRKINAGIIHHDNEQALLNKEKLFTIIGAVG